MSRVAFGCMFVVLIGMTIGPRMAAVVAADKDSPMQAAPEDKQGATLSIQLWKFADAPVEVTLDGNVIYDDRDPKTVKVTVTGKQTDSGPVDALKTISVASCCGGLGSSK